MFEPINITGPTPHTKARSEASVPFGKPQSYSHVRDRFYLSTLALFARAPPS